MDASETVQESLFIPLDPNQVDITRHFSVKYLFDTVGYRHATKDLSDPKAELIDKLQERFKAYLLPNATIKHYNFFIVAIVF